MKIAAAATLAFGVLASSFSLAATQHDRVVAPVSSAQRVTLQDHVPHWATAARDLGAVESGIQLDALKINLSRSPEREAAFQQLLNDQQNPGSPRYHQWLSPEQIAAQFGPTDHDIQQVKDWLAAEGLTVTEVAATKQYVRFNGTAQTVNRAFHTELHYFTSTVSPTGRRISANANPQVPAALAPVIYSVSGLVQHIYTSALHRTMQPGLTITCSTGYCNFIIPADFATIYDINPAYNAGITGKGQKIAIVARSAVNATDMSNYFTQTGVTEPTINTVVPTGAIAPGEKQTGDEDEAALDVTRSGSVAYGATLDLVTASSTESEDGVDIDIDYIINSHSSLGANIMTISFGSCEHNDGSVDINSLNSTFSSAAAEGITTFVASGDAGAAGCEPYNGTPTSIDEFTSPNGLCSSSYVTCLGGTEFNDPVEATYWNTSDSGILTGTAKSYIPEGAWNESADTSGTITDSATGGGVSSVIATPSWQTGKGVPSARSGRYTPDLAFDSAGHDGYFLCLNYLAEQYQSSCAAGTFFDFSGTSAAAPDMAGIMALVNQKANATSGSGNANPSLYALAAKTTLNVFHDVTVSSSGVTNCSASTPSICNNSTPGPTSLTSGNTPGFNVTTGYDESTGWGSADVNSLVNNYSGALATAENTTSSFTVSPGTTDTVGTAVDLTATVSAAAGSANPTGTITFLVFAGSEQVESLGPYTLAKSTTTSSKASTGSLPTVGLPAGTYSIEVAYSGATGFNSSTSAKSNVTLSPATATIALSPSTQTVTRPGNVTVTATVSGSDGEPTGTITFSAAGESFGPFDVQSLGSGKYGYKFVTPTPTQDVPAGTYSVTATYSGNDGYKSAKSSAVSVTLK